MSDIYKQNPLNPDIPQRCSNCGGAIILGQRKILKRSIKTGKPISFEYTAKCINKKSLLNFLTLGFHNINCSDLLIIESPRSYITNKPHRTILTRGY